jgi:ADP-ribosyl-[dinitrogen reductase] hydrolase
MTPRTSLTDAIRIGELTFGPDTGIVGITFCPGKQGDSIGGAPWHRELDVDLDAVAAWGARAVITLIEPHEMAFLNVPLLGDGVRARGMVWHHLPIVDVTPPDARFDAAWPTAGAEVCALLRAGERVLVHCRGGLGRAGTVAALLAVEMGLAPADAIRAVRAARRGAIETTAQERYVLGYRAQFGTMSQKRV